jgi:DNA-directed RNA polymerase specialized sigma24 family protein
MQQNADINLKIIMFSKGKGQQLPGRPVNQSVKADSTIFQRLAKADKAAIIECIEVYGDFVWSLAKKFTATNKEAEEAVLKIFLDIWKYARRYDPAILSEINFIKFIAYRRLIKHLPPAHGRAKHA